MVINGLIDQAVCGALGAISSCGVPLLLAALKSITLITTVNAWDELRSDK
jgi:hypothetical protein